MIEKYAIVGGDSRIIELAKLLAKDDKKVYTYGLENAKELKNIENIKMCNTQEELVEKTNVIIGPVPFSKDTQEINTPYSNNKIKIEDFIKLCTSKILIAGSIKPNIFDMAIQKKVEIIDIMKREDLAILNAIATAEGAICEAILNTGKILHGSNVLILGFGRIGKVLARKLVGLSVNVTCSARKDQDFAWIEAYGYKKTNINEIGKNLQDYDIIINTVPNILLDENRLKYVRKDCLIIDLASNPGGVDKTVANEMGLKCITALAIPGKIAPITSAKFIKDTIYKILKEKIH